MRTYSIITVTIFNMVICLISIFCAIHVQGKTRNPIVQKQIVYKRLLSISETQELLNKIDPNNPIEVDGQLGKYTQDKWDYIINNRYNEEALNRMKM